jgi:hypothetical protein
LEFVAIELDSHNIEELRSFYRNELGLQVSAIAPSGRDFRPTSPQAPPQAGHAAQRPECTVSMGATSVRFLQSAATRPVYHLAFNIPENKIEQALEWLTSRVQLLPHYRSGQTIIHWPDWNAHSIYFLDAAGNILEVIARHDLHNAAPGPFGPHDFLNLSELGLVVPDPHASMDLLARTFGLATRSVLPGFGAVGDDQGLFIVSAKDRPWMPTDDRLARPFPARALVRHKEHVELTIPATSYMITGTPA